MPVRIKKITITALAVVLFFYGCGKIGDPIPPDPKAYQGVADLITQKE